MTEEEIFHGVLRAARPGKECFWFRRQITDLQEHVEEKTCSRYMDIAQKQVDVEAQTLLSKLRCACGCVFFASFCKSRAVTRGSCVCQELHFPCVFQRSGNPQMFAEGKYTTI